MRLAIISLPLHTNYGGILQSYALKKELECMGHEASVIDRRLKMPFPAWWKAPFVYMNRAFKHMTAKGAAPEVFRECRCRKEYPVLCRELLKFVDAEIVPVMIDSYKDIKEGEYDGFVVGSDQVWRPRYFGKIEDAFLAFAKGWNVRRVAYAASFGTDELEYESETLRNCAALLEEFNAVSVREDRAVMMCDEWFDCSRAVHVLDPVLLREADDYRSIAARSSKHCSVGKVMTYILDPAPNKEAIISLVKAWTSNDIADYSVYPHIASVPVEQRVVPPVEDWLAGFDDADFVVTDSFHACVMAILFHKPFIAVGNSQRGLSRLNSLLEMFGLESRLVHGIDPDDDGQTFIEQPDWNTIDRILEEKRAYSRRFLEDSFKD